MPLSRVLLSIALCATATASLARPLEAACHASSSYDLTVKDDSLLFDRAGSAPFQVELQQGALRLDGRAMPVNAENQDRLTLFERDLRALLPKVRAVAQDGVDLAVQGMRAEADRMQLGANGRAEFERRLASHASALKQRIALSRSTHDWQGDAARQAMQQVAADLLPLLAADLGQQAIEAALRGDLQAAASLRDRAASLATDLQPRMEARMQALQPQVDALCPAVHELAALQDGLRDASGRPLHLLQVDP